MSAVVRSGFQYVNRGNTKHLSPTGFLCVYGSDGILVLYIYTCATVGRLPQISLPTYRVFSPLGKVALVVQYKRTPVLVLLVQRSKQ